MLLAGKVATITGASRGIGREMAQTAARIRAAGGEALAAPCDAARELDVARMVEAAVERFGAIHALVNNAGDGGPTRCFAVPHMIAAVTAFLCSDQVRNISAQCISVTAGEPAL